MADQLALGIDIGGTFTDVVIAGPRGVRAVVKRLTTPDDPARAAIEATVLAIAQAGIDPQQLDRVVHGTTLATNTILEGKGSRIAFVTTRGFASLLQLGRHARIEEERYDLGFDPPAPPVDAALTFEVTERIGPDGSILIPLADDEVRELAALLRTAGVQSVAVCLLHSYANPIHEHRIAALLHEQLAIDIVVSCEVWPEMREYERSTTTAMSAFIGPVMAGYVSALESRLREIGVAAPLFIMESAGGVMSAAQARRRAVTTIESGPAAGVIAAKVVGADHGLHDVIAFDMGGTTAKAALVTAGIPATTNQFQVGGKGSFGTRRSGTGVPIKTPTIDLAEVGAGGGSIAWVDDQATLHVGPRSAGANPGPACYGLGGREPTVTDASVVLGYLDPSGFGDQSLRFDAELSFTAIGRHLATPLGVSVERAAAAVHEIANATMAGAIHVVSVQRGVDPRRYALVTSGGAGPLHAARIAERFAITTVLVPPACGVASALGLLASDLRSDRMRSVQIDDHDITADMLVKLFIDLDALASGDVRDADRAAAVVLRRSAAVRYRGQAHELDVMVDTDDSDAARQLRESFHRQHHQSFGIGTRGPIEIVGLRVQATLPVPLAHFSRPAMNVTAPRATRRAWSGRAMVETPVVAVAALIGSAATAGPALLETPEATVLVPAGWSATVAGDGAVTLQRDGFTNV